MLFTRCEPCLLSLTLSFLTVQRHRLTSMKMKYYSTALLRKKDTLPLILKAFRMFLTFAHLDSSFLKAADSFCPQLERFVIFVMHGTFTIQMSFPDYSLCSTLQNTKEAREPPLEINRTSQRPFENLMKRTQKDNFDGSLRHFDAICNNLKQYLAICSINLQ